MRGSAKEIRGLDCVGGIGITELHAPEDAFRQFIIRLAFNDKAEGYQDFLEIRVLHKANTLLGEIRERVEGNVEFKTRKFRVLVNETRNAWPLNQKWFAVVARDPTRHPDFF